MSNKPQEEKSDPTDSLEKKVVKDFSDLFDNEKTDDMLTDLYGVHHDAALQKTHAYVEALHKGKKLTYATKKKVMDAESARDIAAHYLLGVMAGSHPDSKHIKKLMKPEEYEKLSPNDRYAAAVSHARAKLGMSDEAIQALVQQIQGSKSKIHLKGKINRFATNYFDASNEHGWLAEKRLATYQTLMNGKSMSALTQHVVDNFANPENNKHAYTLHPETGKLLKHGLLNPQEGYNVLSALYQHGNGINADIAEGIGLARKDVDYKKPEPKKK